MLYKLIIKDIILIKYLEVEFKNGFTVLTGETGTGKSILIDSLGLILGERANYKLIRKEKQKGIVTAIFNDVSNNVFKILSSEFGLDIKDELIIRREINLNGKSPSYINDIPVSLNVLKRISNHLIEIQGQFENHSLLEEKHHIRLLDNYGVDNNLKKIVSQLWKIYQGNKIKLDELSKNQIKVLKDREWLEYSYKELEDIDPKIDEEIELTNSRKKLINYDKIITTFNEARELVDNENGINDLINRLSRIFSKLENYNDKTIATLNENINDAYASIEEISKLLQNKDFLYVDIKDQLISVDERLHRLRSLSKKHNCKIEDLSKKKNEIEQQIKNIENYSLDIDQLKQSLETDFKKYLEKANELSDVRNRLGKKLVSEMNNELPGLKLENARFDVNIEILDEKSFNETGCNKVIFNAQTNKDTKLGKISEIASGGELSRLLLAMKFIIEKENTFKTLIFDEVDSGVGGSTASAIGNRLLTIGKKQQTIVVTHSPQVAAKGNNHILIKKEFFNNETLSKTFELSDNEKVEEIARMLSGSNITNEARNAALRLIE